MLHIGAKLTLACLLAVLKSLTALARVKSVKTNKETFGQNFQNKSAFSAIICFWTFSGL